MNQNKLIFDTEILGVDWVETKVLRSSRTLSTLKPIIQNFYAH